MVLNKEFLPVSWTRCSGVYVDFIDAFDLASLVESPSWLAVGDARIGEVACCAGDSGVALLFVTLDCVGEICAGE